jgi:hypothetical protein
MNYSKFKNGRLLRYDNDPSNHEQIEIPRDLKLKGLKEICPASATSSFEERSEFVRGISQSY